MTEKTIRPHEISSHTGDRVRVSLVAEPPPFAMLSEASHERAVPWSSAFYWKAYQAMPSYTQTWLYLSRILSFSASSIV